MNRNNYNSIYSIVSHGHNSDTKKLVEYILKNSKNSFIFVTINIGNKIAFNNKRVQQIKNLSPKGFSTNHNAAFASIEHYQYNNFIVTNPDIILNEKIIKYLDGLSSIQHDITAFKHTNTVGKSVQEPRFYPFYKKIFNKKILNKKWFSGAFLVIKKDAYKKLNGFDDKYFMYCEDMDLCYRSELLNLNFNYNVNFNIIHEGMYHSRKRIKYFFYHCKSHILFLMSVR
ncbi:galactosyltransferase-related protein [Amylibacter sp.]|nr:galactosyltransferase-related protein [Amylibacter sp.]